VFLTILVAATPLPGQEEEAVSEGWTPALSMKYHTITGTALSPDGSLAAYVVREPMAEEDESRYLSHIWMVSTSGGAPRQFTRGDQSASSPAFSPDGLFLAFTTGRSGSNQVWVMPVDGGEAKQVTDYDGGIGSFQWAPDGGSFAFTARDPESAEAKAAKEEMRDVILVDQDFRYAHLHSVPFAFAAREVPRVRLAP
jgi:Tol biopolymer transport system component